MPEPSSVSPPTFVSSVTTLGNTLAATCSTDSSPEVLTAERGAEEAGTSKLLADSERSDEHGHSDADCCTEDYNHDTTHNESPDMG